MKIQERGWLGGHVIHKAKPNKEAHSESETEKDIPKQGDKATENYEDALSPGKEVFQPQGPLLCS